MEARNSHGGWRERGRFAHTFAAIDLGTNNCRLMIARAHREGFAVVDSYSRIVRLGEGLNGTGRLSDRAIARTVDALRVCADKIEQGGVTVQRHIATEACRRAENCRDFVDLVEQRTGLTLEIIPPEEEARLALAGCMPLVDPRHRFTLLIDIGGGSTEISWISVVSDADNVCRARPIDFLSLPYGVVTMSEQLAGHYVDGRLSAESYDAVVREVSERVQAFDRRNDIAGAIARERVQMIGTSGTVTTVAAIDLGLRRYNRSSVDGRVVLRSSVIGICRKLQSCDLAGLAANGCIGVERADLVLAGCAILEGLCQRWPVDRITVADRGLREGLLLDMMRACDGAAA